ncbi:hypothetical protein LC092_05475 [Stappia stellulata]|uniref:glycoside hydrolase family 108 protein n=1 Tax=Stappia stellulata TaxID=71235 RepID=UPI001CD73B24|nr:glycosyl hydrolase 108 family protein [Stappia stellulata]MCA1241878.1 hypothetical protein [Stappia stellulata]
MTSANFKHCLPWTLGHEGGYVNHPDDPGGATNKGVTQRVYDGWRRRMGLPTRSVRFITDEEVAHIYRTQYWNAVAADALPAGLDYCTFDAAVNSGPSRGVKWLQQAVGARVDGQAGHETVGKARDHPNKPAAVKRMCAIRMGFLQRLRHWSTFGRGWTRRVADVEARSVAMALKDADAGAGLRRAMQDEASRAEKVAKRDGRSAAGSTAASGGCGTQATGEPSAVADPAMLDQLAPWLWIGGAVAAGAVALWLLHRWSINTARGRAYRSAVSDFIDAL